MHIQQIRAVNNSSADQYSSDHDAKRHISAQQQQQQLEVLEPQVQAPFKEGMTLEDDVESMLSEQFNTSNESMFKVRGVGNLGPGGGAGDSTYRCNDSMQDEDRGLISESEDGWQQHDLNIDNKIDDISEHSSDDVTDSDPEEAQEGVEKPKKPKKAKGEKGEKKKKKKKKLEEDA